MSVAWDSSGKYIVGEGTGGGFGALRADSISMISSEMQDFGDGPTMYTAVLTSIGRVYFFGDQTQAIVDLLANPPAP